jgi:hypothetical protein
MAIGCATLLTGSIYAPVALAQIATLPPGINTRPQLSSDDEKAIASFLDGLRSKFTGDDLDAMRDARREVLALLQPQGVSVDFKLKLGAQLVPIIRQLVDTGDETRVINGLRMAGELATQPCVEILTSKLGDAKTTVRLAAGAAINRALESLAGPAPAMQAGGANSLIAAVADRLKVETDPAAADPMVRALAAALNISSASLAESRSSAFARLASIMADRTAALGSGPASEREMENLIRAGSAIRDALTGAGGKQVPQQAVKDAAALAGESLAYVKRLLKEGVYPQVVQNDPPEAQASKTEARAAAVQLVFVAENIAFYALSISQSTPPAQTTLAQSLKSAKTADDARFAEDVKGLIGPQGTLVKTYSFESGRFTN